MYSLHENVLQNTFCECFCISNNYKTMNIYLALTAIQQRPRSASEERGRQRSRRKNVEKPGRQDDSVRSEALSEDSGNSSLNTFTLLGPGKMWDNEGKMHWG